MSGCGRIRCRNRVGLHGFSASTQRLLCSPHGRVPGAAEQPNCYPALPMMLPLRHLRAVCCLLASAWLLPGCDGFSPSDEPLPTSVALRAAFGAEPPGKGYVKEDEGVTRRGGIVTDAIFVEGEFSGELSHVSIQLLPEEAPPDTFRAVASLSISGVPLEDLHGDTEFETTVYYDGMSGRGRVAIISASEERVVGVFAADVDNNPASPFELRVFERVLGGFNAERSPQSE